MTARRALLVAALTATAAVFAWILFVGLPRWYGSPTRASAAPSPSAPAAPGRKIKAHLFYVADDGLHLSGVEQDVAYADAPAAQAQEILNAQIAPVAEPLMSAIPPGTKLRALYITDRGEAFVDFTGDIVAHHTGGSLDELLTVYTIVDALAANLPAITGVQILVDGKSVDTLAGHVDLRRPLAKDLAWVMQ